MRANATILALLLVTASAAAVHGQQAPERAYSRDTLLRLFAETAEQESENPFRYRHGAIEFDALGASWLFKPLLPVMHGTLNGVMMELPDPFALTGTALATTARSWRTRREGNVELLRIEKAERAKIKVMVKTQ